MYPPCCIFFFFNDTATTEIYTLSLHDALPIWPRTSIAVAKASATTITSRVTPAESVDVTMRSEEHTSELQSPDHLVCRLLLEKKKNISPSDTSGNLLSPPDTLPHFATPTYDSS